MSSLERLPGTSEVIFKGASQKRRSTQFVTNTVLDDSNKGTTEQFVLHFNEQFRQLEEVSDTAERFPPPVRLTLL